MSVVAGMVAAGVLVGSTAAGAEPPTSSVEVSPTTVAAGGTFTVTQTIFNPEDFTVTGGKPAIYGKESAIVGIADLVGCSGNTAPCHALGSSYRAPVGDVPPGESRTVVFTLRVKDDAVGGAFTLQHQFVGDNFSFETFDGPVVTVVPPAADLAVSLGASAHGLLVSRVDYTITVRNNGPGNATGIRLVATYAAGLQFARSNDCTRVAGTRNVNCDVAALPAGSARTLRFSADAGLLALGPFTTRVVRQQSTPSDPNPTNDSAARTCTALTGLLVSC